jgi:sodium transport system permease protein
MLNPILTVLRKECKDHLRDRRTLLMIFLLSVAMGPVMLFALNMVFSEVNEKIDKREVTLLGREHGPNLVNFFERQNVKLIDAPKDYEAKVKQGELTAVLIIPPIFNSEMTAGDTSTVELYYDDSRTNAGYSLSLIRGLLSGYNAELAAQRLFMRGVSPDVTRGVEIKHTNLATPKQRAAMAMASLPMILLFACLSGGMYIAIDASAGERERGSLEPLLLNAVPVEAIIIGKWLAVSGFAAAVMLAALWALWASLQFFPIPNLEGVLNLSTEQLPSFYLILLPFACFAAAVQLLLASFGKNNKEAQSYVGYLVVIAAFLPMLALMSDGKETAWHYWVPFLAQSTSLVKVLRDEVMPINAFLIPMGVCVLGSAVCLWAVSRLWQKEAVIFGRA